MNKNQKILGTIVIPTITLLICILLCALHGVHLFETKGNWLTFFRAAATVMCTTFALSINLSSGRFDFSIGAVSLLSSVISAQLVIQFDLPLGVMLLTSLLMGGLLGLCSGSVYVCTNLPPIIVSLGVSLFYEGAAFTLTGGYGVSFVSNLKLTAFPSIKNYCLVILLVLILMILIYDHTIFGYEYRALLSGQKVAVDTGIKEIPNVLGCYIIAGALMGMVGFMSATNTGTIQMSLNFGSISVMFSAFLPMFIGGFIGRYSNDKLGYLFGAITTALISLTYIRLDVDSSVQQIITAIILVGFLIYLNNESKIRRVLHLKH